MNKSLGEVFRSAWGTTKNNFIPLLVGIALYIAPILVLSTVEITSAPSLAKEIAPAIQLFSFLYVLLVAPLYLGYTTSILRSWHLMGTPAKMSSAWAAAKANYGRYLLTILAALVISLAVILVISIIVSIVTVSTLFSTFSYGYLSDPAVLIGMIMPAIIVSVVLVLIYALFISFIQFIPGMEFPSAFRAVFASFKYVARGNFLKTLGHTVLIGLIVGGIAILIFLPVYISYCSVVFSSHATNAEILAASQQLLMAIPVYSMIASIVSIFLQTFTTPYLFEVYLNAKHICDGKDAQKLQRTYGNPYSGSNQTTNQNTWPPYGGTGNPPQFPPR